MNTLIRPCLGALVLTVVLAGCRPVDNRIKEKPDVFAKLDPVIQSKIKQGIIDLEVCTRHGVHCARQAG